MKYLVGLAAYYAAVYYAMKSFALFCRRKP